MPNGVPVATVALNGAKNAGILAAEILAISDPILDQILVDFKNGMRDTVLSKNWKINNVHQLSMIFTKG